MNFTTAEYLSNFTGAESCLLAALALTLPPIGDLSRVHCRLYTLERLTQLDAAPFDPLATACVTPSTLLDAAQCSDLSWAIPEKVDNTDIYPLYNSSAASEFFEAQTAVQTCIEDESPFSSIFSVPASSKADPTQKLCSCADINALKTLGSPRRAAILSEHDRRAVAANTLRTSRAEELKLLRRLVHLIHPS